MTDLATRPEVLDPSTGEPMVAHIIRKDEQMKGYLGGEIEALCGKRWIPSRDYEGLPVCEACKAELERIRSAGSN